MAITIFYTIRLSKYRDRNIIPGNESAIYPCIEYYSGSIGPIYIFRRRPLDVYSHYSTYLLRIYVYIELRVYTANTPGNGSYHVL